MKVAAIQMTSTMSCEANLEQALQLLSQAQEQGAELAVLPEYFCLMGRRDGDKLLIQERMGQGPIQEAISNAAQELGLWIVAGSLPLSPAADTHSPQVFNSSLAFDPQGRCVARYDKMHLFQFKTETEQYDEHRSLLAGQQPALFELNDREGQRWRIGLSICYDLRFPELYRFYAQAQADVLLVPSAFTQTTGEAHWETLLKARAIENLAYVIAPAQSGLHDNGRRTHGHTLVVDPWGVMAGQLEHGVGVLMAELSHERLSQCRGRLPALAHRRL
jgi:deaminated glutathione amidase